MPRLVAAEILTSAWCPFSCTYCYIPKTDQMHTLHDEIVESLRSGKSFDILEQVVGEDLTELGLWGTEPSLTLPVIEDKLAWLVETFPKLKRISFSTNLVNPDTVAHFVTESNKHGIACKVQVSVDGPAFITDKNRNPGAAAMIQRNVIRLTEAASDFNLRWKATLTPDNIKKMVDSPDRIDEYEAYFAELCDSIHNKSVDVARGSSVPTICVPGKYTSDDGRTFACYVHLVHSKGFSTAYLPRLQRIANFASDLYGKRSMFSCSGGDSNCGLSENQHLCHRSFYYDLPAYIESLSEFDSDNWDVSNLENGSIQLLVNRYIVKPGDELNKARYNYVMRGYHDFWAFQLASTVSMVKALALSGQCEHRFLEDDHYAALFATFVNTAMSCPMENILNTGSPHITPVSELRMFGNGAFGEVLNELSKRK